jgi:hypothetical protein
MLTALAPNLWYATYAFKVNGLPLTTRMTVVRLPRGHLWLHSPIPIAPKLTVALDALANSKSGSSAQRGD